MKEIRLVHFSEEPGKFRGKQFSVCLGNGTKNIFQSKRDAVTFIGSTNNFLNNEFHRIHKLYTESLLAYHQVYFYLGPSEKQNNYLIEQSIINELNSIPKSLELCWTRAGFPNGNFFSFTHLFSVVKALQCVIRTLNPIYIGISNRSDIYLLDDIFQRLQYANIELEKYGTWSGTVMFPIPTHLTDTSPDYAKELVKLFAA